MSSRAFRTPIRLLLLFFTSILLYFCLRSSFTPKHPNSVSSGLSSNPYPKQLVVASLKSDNVSWLEENLPDWHANVYVVDDPKAKLMVPMNKGRESMVYLTYIIDHYDRLPDYMVFMHGQRYQWHNDDPIYDGVPIIRSLRLPYVEGVGFAPLRCTWVPGCPAEIYPLNPSENGRPARIAAERAYAPAFRTLFPNMRVPKEVGATCSSQFAATRERVRQRRKSDYERMRQWLIETDLDDAISGRVMEYAWHMRHDAIINTSSQHMLGSQMVGLKKAVGSMDGQHLAGISDTAWQMRHGNTVIAPAFTGELLHVQKSDVEMTIPTPNNAFTIEG
ncbi:hypothetical protein PRK78_002748 [Emydomyces testavorans]|uniref:Uncharacterized protein n=1 Tax=Emydomyces testavorans TaxID=2070801 RepID=A0AAF0IHU6_9EURO|nr:hypothetical protein PRK78_002748 [Emydomyces testavorans]